jgi:hypothetical protein
MALVVAANATDGREGGACGGHCTSKSATVSRRFADCNDETPATREWCTRQRAALMTSSAAVWRYDGATDAGALLTTDAAAEVPPAAAAADGDGAAALVDVPAFRARGSPARFCGAAGCTRNAPGPDTTIGGGGGATFAGLGPLRPRADELAVSTERALGLGTAVETTATVAAGVSRFGDGDRSTSAARNGRPRASSSLTDSLGTLSLLLVALLVSSLGVYPRRDASRYSFLRRHDDARAGVSRDRVTSANQSTNHVDART